MLAAFIVAFSGFAAAPGSDAYVQGGLVLHLDGIDNSLSGGVRSHADAPSVWNDLSGQGNDFTLPSFVTVEANAMLSAANTNKKPDTDTSSAPKYPTRSALSGLKHGTNEAPFAVEVVAQRVKWTYTDNYFNLQSVFGTPRGAVGYRHNQSDGFYFFYPRSKDTLTLMNWSAGRPAGEAHTISAVFGNSSAEIHMDGGPSVALDRSGNYETAWSQVFSLFGNARADVRIHAVRVYNRELTSYERARNHQLDRARFLGATDIPFLVKDLPGQTFTGAPVAPDPVVVDPLTERVLEKGVDYAVSYAGNDRPGYATATVTGLGAWSAFTQDVTFLVCAEANYRVVDYIQSTGTQFIDTEYLPGPTTRMEADIQFVGGAADRSATRPCASPFGTAEADGQVAFSMNFGASASQDNDLFTWFDRSYLNGKGSPVKSFAISAAQRTSRQTFTMDGANGAVTYGSTRFTALRKTTTHRTNALVLFGSRANTGEVTPFTYYGLRVYGWKIWDGATLVRDFVPCYRLFDLHVGLLDRVSGRFFDNAGAGAFSYDVTTYRPELPAAYHRLDWLVATGTQEVPTGVTAASDVTVMGEFLPFTANAGMWVAAGALSRHAFTLDAWGGAFYLDGVKRAASASPQMGSGQEIVLLAADGAVRGHGRLHCAYIWKAGALVRHFVPCYRVADRATGLYDLVDGAFHPSTPEPALHGLGGEVGVPRFGGEARCGFLSGRHYNGLTNFSFSVWVKNPSVGSYGYTSNGTTELYGTVLAQGALGNLPGFCCFVQQVAGIPDRLRMQTRSADNKTTTWSAELAPLADGKWHHVAFTHDWTAKEGLLYVDGRAVDALVPGDARTMVDPTSWSWTQFSMGVRNQNGTENSAQDFSYRGELAQVTLWNRALSADEVDRLRRHPVTGTEPGLLDAWPLESGEAGLKALVTGTKATLAPGDIGFADDSVQWFKPGLSVIVR